MNIPGFAAEASLYKTSGHYRLTGGLVRADGVMPQLVLPPPDCSTCYSDNTGACVASCRYCLHFPQGGGGCFPYTALCHPWACCDAQCARIKDQCFQLQCSCLCHGGVVENVDPTLSLQLGMHVWLAESETAAKILYPMLRVCRLAALAVLGRSRIN
jgi:hypothetical protein